MATLSKDARFFVEGVTKYLRGSGVELPKVHEAFRKITSEATMQKTATVESAVALDSGEKADVSRFLARLLAHPVRLVCRVNKDLIGGLRIVVGDWVVDTSLASQLRAVTEMLTQ